MHVPTVTKIPEQKQCLKSKKGHYNSGLENGNNKYPEAISSSVKIHVGLILSTNSAAELFVSKPHALCAR